MSVQGFTSRRWGMYALVALGVIALGVEIIFFAPLTLERWHPYDYWQYTQMGEAVREGRDPLGPGRYYPLPTIVWLFVPLSFLPVWFRLIWILVPVIFVFLLFRRDALWLLLYTPLWFNVSDAMLDAWLLVPLTWLLTNRPVLAGVGAVAMLIKPQLAILTVAYAFLRWLVERDWRNLAAFALTLTLFALPAFIINSNWVARLLQVLPLRASETTTILPAMTSSVWSWWALGPLGVAGGAVLLLVGGVFFVRAFRQAANRANAFQALNALLVPILFASNSVTLVPALQNRKQILSIVAVSLAAFLLDLAVKNFGGGYALIPILVLYFQSQPPSP